MVWYIGTIERSVEELVNERYSIESFKRTDKLNLNNWFEPAPLCKIHVYITMS